MMIYQRAHRAAILQLSTVTRVYFRIDYTTSRTLILYILLNYIDLSLHSYLSIIVPEKYSSQNYNF